MKSKVILKWTKWFYRALVVLIVALINVGPWFYLDGYKPYGGMADVIGYLVEYNSLYLNSYICFGVLLIGLFLLVLSFVRPDKFKFFTITLAVSILVMLILMGGGIILPIVDDYEISKVWWIATACSFALVISAVVGKICEKKLEKEEQAETKNTTGVVAASIYGVVTLVLFIVSIVVACDKGWRIEDDTLYIEREIGIYHSFDDDETLWGNGEFEELKVENGVREIQYIGLCNNEDFEEVDLPKSLRIIGEFAFSDCKNLYEIDIPNNVERIEWAAFYRCENLSQVELSDDLEVIEGRAFYGCYSLTSITIPKSVKEIGDDAFPDDTVLTVESGSYAEQWAIENGYTYEIY